MILNCEKNVDYKKELNDVMVQQFETYNVTPGFPTNIANLTENELSVGSTRIRKDFRGEKAFTIDCEDCKDMDDAVCVLKTSKGYRLSVHIADVSEYAPLGSELDIVAMDRATSMYFPDYTIPMLPTVLSNNCCSLNPNVNRLTLSVIINLNKQGHVRNYEIVKGMIRSRVKGVYAEVNRILEGSKDTTLLKKYEGVYNELFDMKELYELLRLERIRRGSSVDNSSKPKIRVSNNDILLTPKNEGIAENIIEEFMILANRIVSEYLCEKDLPAIFRIQEEKNRLAAYQPIKLHHAELALESYTHFTSPIRRVADLKVHQIITMHLNGIEKSHIHELFDEALLEVCERATKRSRTANHMMEMCEKYCYKEYFKLHSEQFYTGSVIGYDRKHRPIVHIDKYNIKAVGAAQITVNVGDKISFKICIFDNSNDLNARCVHRITA